VVAAAGGLRNRGEGLGDNGLGMSPRLPQSWSSRLRASRVRSKFSPLHQTLPEYIRSELVREVMTPSPTM
jgi:hypothetical protein